MIETIVALITPFSHSGAVDFKALEHLLHFHLENKTHSILILGSTAESALLSFEEKEAILKMTSEVLAGKKEFIVGISSPSTQECIQIAKLAKKFLAKKVLVTLPFYIKTTFEGYYQHFEAISKEGIEMVLYENPSRVGIEFPIELLKKLEKIDLITSIKASTNNLTWLQQVINETQLKVYCGDDLFLPTFNQLNQKQIISVIANAFPNEVAHFDMEFLAPILKIMNQYPNPVGIKALMHNQGFCENEVRLPLLKTDSSCFDFIDQKVLTNKSTILT